MMTAYTEWYGTSTLFEQGACVIIEPIRKRRTRYAAATGGSTAKLGLRAVSVATLVYRAGS